MLLRAKLACLCLLTAWDWPSSAIAAVANRASGFRAAAVSPAMVPTLTSHVSFARSIRLSARVASALTWCPTALVFLRKPESASHVLRGCLQWTESAARRVLRQFPTEFVWPNQVLRFNLRLEILWGATTGIHTMRSAWRPTLPGSARNAKMVMNSLPEISVRDLAFIYHILAFIYHIFAFIYHIFYNYLPSKLAFKSIIIMMVQMTASKIISRILWW